MLVWQTLRKGDRGQIGQRNKTSILWAGGPYAFSGEPPLLFLRSDERNKIKILLRLEYICATM